MIPNKYCTLLLIIFLSPIFKPIWANHLVAGQMSYHATDNPNEYKISMKLYRNCGGKELCSSCPSSLSPDCQISLQIEGYEGIYANQNFGSASLKIVSKSSAIDMYNPCKMNPSICNNCGTRTPGTFTPGYESYFFEGIVNLNAVPANCCTVKISYQSCCRNNNLSNLQNPSLTNYYQEIMLNRCQQAPNNSPVFATDPIYFVCAGQDESIQLGGAVDPDGDSLSYEKTPLLAASNIPVQYFSPYSDSVPFPYFEAPANPQQGINLNSITGELRFRPMGSFSANLCMRIYKWRKSSSGYQKIGFVSRELNIHTFFCPNNNPPLLRTYGKDNQLTQPQPSKSFILKSQEEFCLTFAASDGTSASDTTNISFTNKEFFQKLGAKFTPLYNPNSRHLVGPKFDSIQFCWAPADSLARSTPYYLFVHAQDQACPIPAKSIMSVQFLVNLSLGLNQSSDANPSIQIFPNPATHLLTISLKQVSKEELTIQLYTIDGILVQTEKMEPLQTGTQLQLKHKEPGFYLLKITGNETHYGKKLLLE
jgi:hypothetical protein